MKRPKRLRKTKLFGLYEWFSFCSAHYNYNDKCHMCRAGGWKFMPAHFFERLLHRYMYKTWFKLKNLK